MLDCRNRCANRKGLEDRLLYPLDLVDLEYVATSHALDSEPVILEHEHRQLLLLAF